MHYPFVQNFINNVKVYLRSTENRCQLQVFDHTDVFCTEHQCSHCRQHGSIDIKYQTIAILLISVAVFLYYSNTIYHTILKKEDDLCLIPPNPVHQLSPSRSKMRVFNRSAVCSDAPACAKIGEDILSRNGSAIDAAISALICNGVVNMHSMGLGGGFLMTIFKRKENAVYSINAREKAPMFANEKMYEHKNISSKGPLSMGVPGQIKGYLAVHERFGKLPWKDLVAPSIELCEKGYNMSTHQYLSLRFRGNLTDDPHLRRWFYKDNLEFKQTNSTIIPTKLCETLKILSQKGPDDFYFGSLSKMFLKDIADVGGIITKDDFENYQVEWQDPHLIPLRNGDRFYSAPPPGSGAIAGFILNILEGFNFTKQDISSVENTIITYHRILESFKYAYAKRTELGDPNFVNMRRVLRELSSKEYADYVRTKINDHRTYTDPSHYGAEYFTKSDKGTAHLAVIAPNGDAVSVTSTINIFFGAGMTSKSTGIIFNSIMDDFSYPGIVNFFGLEGSPKNKIEPGKRPLSSMTPSIVIDRNNNVKLVVGGAGGSQITTSTALILISVLWLGKDIKEALDSPRIHHQLMPMNAFYEFGTLQQIVTGLKRLGHTMRRGTGSVACALYRNANIISGNADFRKGGDVSGK